jgi:putative heme-binding domain-containing protein
LSSAIYWAKGFSAGARISEEPHIPAIKLLSIVPYPEARTNLLRLISTNEIAFDTQRLALETMTLFPDKDWVPDVLDHWRELASASREEAIQALAKRPRRIRALLEAIQSGLIQPKELTIAQQSQLRSDRDPAIRALAEKILGRAATGGRQSVIDAFQFALAAKGDGLNGHIIFQARCASCHKFGTEGHTLGPDLATVKSGGKDKLLIAILDPNREVAPNFASYAVDTKDGESITGILASENANSVTLRMAGGAESVIPRANITSLQSQGRSLMPEGLEEGLKPQDIADLLEFIVGAK